MHYFPLAIKATTSGIAIVVRVTAIKRIIKKRSKELIPKIKGKKDCICNIVCMVELPPKFRIRHILPSGSGSFD